MSKAGATWWGKRWIEALASVLGGDSARLARGRTYARAGRTHDLVVKGGKVTAKVTGSRATPYKIAIALSEFSERVWTKALEGLAQRAQFSAELLAGQMPQSIDEVFATAGVSLFAQQRGDLRTSCSCPDWGDPCKHVAATHYVLGEALDRDPFLLFEMRGKSKAQVLDALRTARGASEIAAKPDTESSTPRADTSLAVPTVTLGELTAESYDRPREPLPSLRFGFEETVSQGALLRQLGAPAAWQSPQSPAETLAPLVRAAARAARQLALADPSQHPEPPPRAPKAPPKRATKKRASG